MALINCSECNAEVSDKAESCPKCGNPITRKQINLFSENNEEDKHIKKIYSYVKLGKNDTEISDILNEIKIKTMDGNEWSKKLIKTIRKDFKLDTKSPVFLSQNLDTPPIKPKRNWFMIILAALCLLYVGQCTFKTRTTTSSSATPSKPITVSESEKQNARYIIELKGYTCKKIEAIHPFLLSTGYSVYCDDYSYHYEVEDKGGNWQVTVK